MPNIKSAKKRVKVISKKTLQNRMISSDLKTQLKKFDTAAAQEDKELVNELYAPTCKKVDMAASKGTIHKNKANRIKAQLSKKISSM